MKIKDEWRKEVANWAPDLLDEEIAELLAAIAPLIACDVIEACCDAAVGASANFNPDGTPWSDGVIEGTRRAAENIRREVSERLGDVR